MDIQTQRKDQGLLVAVRGRMDALMATEFEGAFDSLIRDGGLKVALDMSGLDYVSSAGLRSILGAYKKIKSAGGALVLCGLSGTVKEVFEISGFASIFQVFDTVDAALAALVR